MAFEGLSDKLQGVFKGLKGKGSLTEADINAAMREVKLALLEADVNFKVVKEFVAEVKEKAMGEEVMKSLTPAQQVIKIVNDELVELMGGASSKLTYSPKGFTVYMMVGLQGTGKTTTCGKLAKWLKKNGKKPMLCACDMRDTKDPSKIAKAAIKEAEVKGYNVLIVDTAGRLQIDEELMEELKVLKKEIRPHEILLVVDALTGQDAVNAAEGFNDALGIDGVIMTKMDGDSRGGAALSTKKVTGRPIKFVGMGEKMDELDEFHPERMASRILGMGDMMSLIEKAQEDYDEEQAAKLEEKIKKNKFTLEDFLEQMGQIRNMGGIAKMLDMLPGVSGNKNVNIEQSEQDFKCFEAIIQSMTKAERDDPNLLNASRRKRIAAGSGQPVQKINQLVKRYDESRKMMKQMMNPKQAAKMSRMFGGFKGF